ncbi:MAG: dipicolinate synthase subunit DpsA [Ruminococcus sp.]|jgi:dipicolinate synthase subunit A|nr:dipicolinate synthase subunit DpsA [Ruminococcus sp.]
MKTFAVVGGDLRYIELAESLSARFCVYAMGFDKNVFTQKGERKAKLLGSVTLNENRVDYLILPIPAAKDELHVNTGYFSGDIPMSSLPALINESGTVFAGRLSETHKKMFEDAGISVVDYSNREDFAVMNAVATSEGAIQIAMEETKTTISSQKILILGMGRIAKVLLMHLRGFTDDITAAARKPHDIVWAGIFGKTGISLAEAYKNIGEFDLIFNTIPTEILTSNRLSQVKESAAIIDLASKPGGVDFEAAEHLGIKAIHALSLPGKVAPITAGKVIAKTIENILIERGEGAGEERY